jgi:uncharacterized protein YjbJ (UPF0337 family)
LLSTHSVQRPLECSLGRLDLQIPRWHRQPRRSKERSDMSGGKTDELKGRMKEAAGALTGDEKLKREGQLDQTVGKVKQATDEIIDKVKEAVK